MRRYATLVRALQDAQAVPFVELAGAYGIDMNRPGRHMKGITGKLVEEILGKKADSRPEADLSYFGLEVKSIPVTLDLQPREMTKLTMLNPVDVYDQSWEESTVFHKIRNILFVPIVKRDVASPLDWYIRDPFVWMPSVSVERQLKADYDSIRSLIRSFQFDRISSAQPPAGQGTFLIANTAGADAKDQVRFQLEGKAFSSKRRAFMLRKEITEKILEENVKYTRDRAIVGFGEETARPTPRGARR